MSINSYLSDNNWYKYFSKCSNEFKSMKKMSEFSPKRFFSSLPVNINLVKSQRGKYTSNNYYSEWHINFSTYTNVEIELNIYSVVGFQKLIMIDSNNKVIFSISEFNVNKEFKYEANTRYLAIYYFSRERLNSLPFNIHLDNKLVFRGNNYFKYIVLLSILLFILISESVYMAIRLYIKKKLNNVNNINTINTINSYIVQEETNRNTNLYELNPFNLFDRNKYIKLGILKLRENDLKSIKYNKEIKTYNDLCSICFENFKENEDVVLFSCGHLFHFNCFKINLMKENSKCPNCGLYLNSQNVVVNEMNIKK